ncbi:MAG: VOC family protein [Solirubrobacterales bacterium]
MMATATPYLFFKGNAEEAMNFYKGVFGAELHTIPASAMGSDNPGLMHADLWVGDFRLFASDSPPDFPTTPFGNAEICVNGADDAEMARWFDALSDGGSVEQPLAEMPWGDKFGKFKDRYGVCWMFNVDSSAEQQG